MTLQDGEFSAPDPVPSLPTARIVATALMGKPRYLHKAELLPVEGVGNGRERGDRQQGQHAQGQHTQGQVYLHPPDFFFNPEAALVSQNLTGEKP